ncbi:Trimeric GatFAB AmidoTransferase(AdT) complex subunit [Lecanora helva]
MSLLRNAEQSLKSQKTFKLLNAFVTNPSDAAWLEQHRPDLQRADERHHARSPIFPIDGHTIAIKDNICSLGEPTTCGSGILKGFKSPYEATVIKKLKAAGAVLVGKTNLDEFGMGYGILSSHGVPLTSFIDNLQRTYSTNSIYGPVSNIYVRDSEALSAGGSSGGSAVAVRTGQCDAYTFLVNVYWDSGSRHCRALGTDTGGSVRFPAACTGVVGYKPSYGMVSRWGVIAYANSLDTVGVLARTSPMARKVFDVIKGYDRRDPTSLSTKTRLRIAEQIEKRNSHSKCAKGFPLRVGVPEEYNTQELQPVIRQAWLETLQKLREQGHTIHRISLPATKIALSAYYILAPAEASSNLAKYDGVRYGNKAGTREGTDNVLYSATRGEGLGEEVKRRILLGSYSLSAAAIDNYFIQAQKVRRLVQNDFNDMFAFQHPLLDPQQTKLPERNQKVDIIVTPTAQSPPPKLSAVENMSPIDAYAADVLTVPASLAGLPAINVPVPMPRLKDGDRDPGDLDTVGMQVLAQFGDDDLVFQAAQIIESLSE